MSELEFDKLKRILLATDFSAASDTAREAVAVIARRSGARVTVVHVAVPMQEIYSFAAAKASLPLDRAVVNSADEQLREAAERQLAEFVAPLGAEAMSRVLCDGDVAGAIAGAARDGGADLIVVGTHAREGISRLFLGSVASEVVRVSGVSTLVVPPESADCAFSNILAAVDFSAESVAALHQAAALAMLHDARFTAVHVIDERPLPPYFSRRNEREIQSRARAELERLIAAEDLVVNPDPVVLVGDPAAEIDRHARAIGANLVVAGATGLGALDQLLIGSVATRLLRSAPCAVLAHRGRRATDL